MLLPVPEGQGVGLLAGVVDVTFGRVPVDGGHVVRVAGEVLLVPALPRGLAGVGVAEGDVYVGDGQSLPGGWGFDCGRGLGCLCDGGDEDG